MSTQAWRWGRGVEKARWHKFCIMAKLLYITSSGTEPTLRIETETEIIIRIKAETETEPLPLTVVQVHFRFCIGDDK